MQLYAVNFIPLLVSLYMFRVFYTPIIRSTILKTVSTATGTNHSTVSGETILWFVPVAVDTVTNCTPDDGCVKHPKHVE